jgi:outer membrane protein TolC
MTLNSFFRIAPLVLLAIPVLGFAQDSQPLTLDQAIQLAKKNNGDVRAAVFSEKGARSRVDQARANFFPTITPSYTYNSRRTQVLTPGGSIFNQSEGGTSEVNATLRLLDLGERGFNLKSSQEEAATAEQDALQTLRQVLFQVYSQYYNTLRFQELVASADAQVQRAQSIYDATQAQVEVGQTAKKELLQAQADLANAKVQGLTAQNQFTNAQASLKALIGWQSTQALPSLVSSQPPTEALALPTLDEMVQMGMQNRADLKSARRRNESLRYSSKLADRQATASLGVDASFNQELTPNSLQDRAFVLNLSLPWLDFGRSKAAARQARYSYEASKSTLTQTERVAQSEIEAAYKDVSQNAERLTAAQQAVTAARENFQAASESQKLGVGTVVDVITAQASLATAESGYVQALYDYDTSLVQLRLVTGQSIPGEESART